LIEILAGYQFGFIFCLRVFSFAALFSRSMRYYFHIHLSEQFTQDHGGAYFETFDLAQREAVASGKYLASHLIRDGRPLEGCGIEIADESGRRISFLPLTSLVS
jgi:hypothetical protein